MLFFEGLTTDSLASQLRQHLSVRMTVFCSCFWVAVGHKKEDGYTFGILLVRLCADMLHHTIVPRKRMHIFCWLDREKMVIFAQFRRYAAILVGVVNPGGHKPSPKSQFPRSQVSSATWLAGKSPK